MFKGQRIEIDEYERANLLAALYACTFTYRSPLNVISNGDWIYQIMHKLGFQGTNTDWGRPNASSEELVKRAEDWAELYLRSQPKE